MVSFRTQRVTAVDIANRRIRIPIGQKDPFPSSRGDVSIVLRGRHLDVSYDPRMGPDMERSGVLYVGALLQELVVPDEVLTVVSGDGRILLD